MPLEPPYSVALEDVTLRYGDSDRPAIRNVSFEMLPGRRVALVGPSGAGKTSVMRLLTGAWEPTEGRVLIAGRDIRDYSVHDLRAALGVAAQDTYIFNDTVRNNLLLARPDASTVDLETALDAVGLLETVRALPRGLDTWAGEHGERLSGGERQRLSMARVLLRNAPIVLLDEVTANLDGATERSLLDTIYRVTEGRTLLTITHRLVGLERMDEILVLDCGEIVERGTHDALCAAGGVYKRMLDVQENMLAL
jgi:ATP-binding cassette subfamily C protein CydC